MPKFIIHQTVDLELNWVIDAESVEDALEKAWGNFDSTKVLSIDVLDWDRPWDASEALPDSLRMMSDATVAKWREVGVL
jgi:hypothetical protein